MYIDENLAFVASYTANEIPYGITYHEMKNLLYQEEVDALNEELSEEEYGIMQQEQDD